MGRLDPPHAKTEVVVKFKPELLKNVELHQMLKVIDQWLDVVDMLQMNNAVEGEGLLTFREILEAIDGEINKRGATPVTEAVLSMLYDGVIERVMRPDGEVGYAIVNRNDEEKGGEFRTDPSAFGDGTSIQGEDFGGRVDAP